MDQFEAFQYFITNLFLHNLVLVVVAGLLGAVLGRLIFAGAKGTLDQLRESLKDEGDRAKAAERDLENLKARHEELMERVQEGGAEISPESEEEMAALREEKEALGEQVTGMAKKLETLLGRMERLESEKAALEAELAELREGDDGSVAQREVEKMLATMKSLEQRVTEAEDTARTELEGELEALRSENEQLAGKLADRTYGGATQDEELKKLLEENERLETDLLAARKHGEALEGTAKKVRRPKSLPTRRGSKADVEDLERRVEEALKERGQVEKASAVLRKEMRGLRNKVKEIEQKESRESGLEQALTETEERLTRAQATVAKETRVRASLEKMVEDLEWKLAEAGAERERLRDAVEEVREPVERDGAGGASGAADALRVALEEEDRTAGEADGGEEPAEPEPPAEVAEDDLTRIKGIGAVLAKKLQAGGVTTFRQLADWTDEDLETFSTEHRLMNRAVRDDWRGQARALCDSV